MQLIHTLISAKVSCQELHMDVSGIIWDTATINYAEHSKLRPEPEINNTELPKRNGRKPTCSLFSTRMIELQIDTWKHKSTSVIQSSYYSYGEGVYKDQILGFGKTAFLNWAKQHSSSFMTRVHVPWHHVLLSAFVVFHRRILGRTRSGHESKHNLHVICAHKNLTSQELRGNHTRGNLHEQHWVGWIALVQMSKWLPH